MSSKTNNKFRNTPLNPKLLATPFKVNTDWFVITGASCSGKTTIIDLLAEEGYHTVPESGRLYISEELEKGRKIDEIREDQADLAHKIYDLMVRTEDNLPTDEKCFLDRALPDAFSFFRFKGINPNEVFPDCFKYHYASVFILDRLPYIRDGVRAADDETAAYYERWLLSDYKSLGYKTIRVPVLPPDDRINYILEIISETTNL